MAYRFVLVRWLWMILDDLVAGLSKCNSTNTCTAFRTVSTDKARRAVPRRQLTELLVYINDVANCDMNTDLWFRCCERASDVNLSILRVVWKCEYNKSVHTLTSRSQPYAHFAYLIANHFTINMQMTCNCMYHSTQLTLELCLTQEAALATCHANALLVNPRPRLKLWLLYY